MGTQSLFLPWCKLLSMVGAWHQAPLTGNRRNKDLSSPLMVEDSILIRRMMIGSRGIIGIHGLVHDNMSDSTASSFPRTKFTIHLAYFCNKSTTRKIMLVMRIWIQGWWETTYRGASHIASPNTVLTRWYSAFYFVVGSKCSIKTSCSGIDVTKINYTESCTSPHVWWLILSFW